MAKRLAVRARVARHTDADITHRAVDDRGATVVRMKRLFTIALVAGFTLPSLGCLVTTRDHHHGRGSQASSRGRSCPPGYHLTNVGGHCAKNGNGKAKGHQKHRR